MKLQKLLTSLPSLTFFMPHRRNSSIPQIDVELEPEREIRKTSFEEYDEINLPQWLRKQNPI